MPVAPNLKGEINMARMCSAAVGGNTKEIDAERRKEQFNETQVGIAKELDKLIDKIGVVNVLALLCALNNADIVNIDSPYSADFKAKGWFSLDACGSIAINVDDKLNWQERWCDIGKIDFGLK